MLNQNFIKLILTSNNIKLILTSNNIKLILTSNNIKLILTALPVLQTLITPIKQCKQNTHMMSQFSIIKTNL